MTTMPAISTRSSEVGVKPNDLMKDEASLLDGPAAQASRAGSGSATAHGGIGMPPCAKLDGGPRSSSGPGGSSADGLGFDPEAMVAAAQKKSADAQAQAKKSAASQGGGGGGGGAAGGGGGGCADKKAEHPGLKPRGHSGAKPQLPGLGVGTD